jgi:hypothetical protein
MAVISYAEANPGKSVHDYNNYVKKVLENIANSKYPKRNAGTKSEADFLSIKQYDASKLPLIYSRVMMLAQAQHL